MIVYNKYTGEIIAKIPNDQDINVTYANYSDEFRESLKILKDDGLKLDDLTSYKVVDGKLIKRSDEENKELKMYGKVLTEEERLNILLQPTAEEIRKAETTIEMLTMLQEVGLI